MRPRLPIVIPLLRHTPEALGHDHGLADAADDAEHEHLLGMDFQHLAPDTPALLAVVRMAPGVVQRVKPAGAIHVRRLSGSPAGLVILAPFRPLQLLLAGGGELGRAHRRRGKAVFPAGPDRHQRLPGKDAVAQQFALQRLGVELDPELQPAVVDQVQDVGLFGALAGGLDDEFRRAPVGKQAEPVIAPAQARLVEEGIGRLGIVGRPALPQRLVVKRASRQQAVVAGKREAEIDHFVDLFPVEAERQRPAHPPVPEQRPPDGIAGIEVGVERRVRALARAPQADLVAARLLAAFQEGHIVEPQVTGLEVACAGGGLRRDEPARGDVHHHAVDIGKLAAPGVHPVVVGIAGEDEAVRGRPDGRRPGLQGRQVRIVVLVLAVQLVVQRRPGAPARLFHGRGQRLGCGMRGMEAPQIVRRAVDIERPRACQRRQEAGIRRLPAITEGPFVQHLEDRRLAVHEHRRRRSGRRELGIVGDILPPVAEVLSGEGMPVRPFVTRPEMQGEDAAFLGFHTLQNVRLQHELRRVAHEARIAVHDHLARVLRLGHQQAQVAAMSAGAGLRIDIGDGRQAPFDRRQRPGADPLG